MATPITGAGATDPTVIEFLASASIEAQFAYIANKYLTAQATYNTANPVQAVNRVTIIEGNTDVQIRLGLPLANNAASLALVAAVDVSEFSPIKLTDGAATGAVATLIALPSLEAQIAILAVQLQDLEMTYNATLTVGTGTPLNRVTLTPNYDSRFFGIVATLPLQSSATSRPVAAYLP